MKFKAKNLLPVAFHALTCVEVSVIQCFDLSKMAAEVFPVARIALTSMQNRASPLSNRGQWFIHWKSKQVQLLVVIMTLKPNKRKET